MTDPIDFNEIHMAGNAAVQTFGGQANDHGWKPVTGSAGAYDAAFDETGWPVAPGPLVGHAALTYIAAGGGFLSDLGYVVADARTPGRACLSTDVLTRSSIEHLSTGVWVLAPELPGSDEAARLTRVERAYITQLDSARHYLSGREVEPKHAKAPEILADSFGDRLKVVEEGPEDEKVEVEYLGGTSLASLTARARRLEKLAFGRADKGAKEIYSHLSTSSHPNFYALNEMSQGGATHFTLSDETLLTSFRVAAVSFATAWEQVAGYHGWDTDDAVRWRAEFTDLSPGARAGR
jgi:hypothetical protein